MKDFASSVELVSRCKGRACFMMGWQDARQKVGHSSIAADNTKLSSTLRPRGNSRPRLFGRACSALEAGLAG
jgi:hypothetical protein